MAGGGGKAPKPDPNIGIAAMKSAETGEKWLEVAKEQFGVANERQDKLDALTSQVTNEQLTSMKQANEWASQDRERYIGTFRPMEDEFIETANNWDSPERRAQVASEAKADVQNAATTARQSRERQMTGMGVNPASGRFAGIEASADTATALASAGAQNAARKQVEAQGIARKSDAINMGRGLPSQATQALGLSLSPGRSLEDIKGKLEAARVVYAYGPFADPIAALLHDTDFEPSVVSLGSVLIDAACLLGIEAGDIVEMKARHEAHKRSRA